MTGPSLSGVSLSLARTEYRRGDAVEVVVTVPDPDGSQLRAGLVCTERYMDKKGESPDVFEATQWEEWQELSGSTSLPQRLSFTIPRSEPYSHRGSVLWISWAVVVRRPRRLRRDPSVVEPIWTDP